MEQQFKQGIQNFSLRNEWDRSFRFKLCREAISEFFISKLIET